MDKLGINLGYLLFQILNFAVLAVLLGMWAFKPIVKMLENRKQKIAQGMEDARIAADARANAEKEAATIITDAQAKAAQVVSDALKRAEAAVLEMRAGSENELFKEREAALAEVQEERDRMLGDLRGQVAALAIAAAQKLVGDSLDERRQHTLLSEFFSGVKSGKVIVLEGVELAGAAAEVVSALPLSDEEQAMVRRDVLSKMGSQGKVSFRVDPSILGGLIIQVGDKVLDGSISGQFELLKQSLR